MSDIDAPLQSNLWYRVAAVRPQLLARAKLHRHRYRGEVWYLLQDPASGRVHRFTPAARLILAAMDGRRSVEDLWQLAQRQLGDDAPTQDEVIQLLGQLHGADLLATDSEANVLEVFERGERTSAARRRRMWANPMAFRIPLWDPGAFLDRHVGLWRWLWGRPGALLWLAVVVPALVLVPPHWPELTGNLSDRVLQADNLLLLGLVFPFIKALHELGHASATRAAGGEVHDMGLMLLVLMPIPYVDASSATVLRSRWHRAVIGAAGMIVELFIAALAFYLWLAVEPGLTRALCFNVMLVAGVSTLIFNGNPLLRYDAYYILADLIEMPNLAQRAARYWGYLLQRHVLRLRDLESPAQGSADAWWLGAYGLLSAAYRLFVTIAIALFIGTRFFFFGVILAVWAVAMMIVVPIARSLKHLRAQPAVREGPARVAAIIVSIAVALLGFVTLVPLPHRALSEGVVWLPERATVRAGVDGFVSHLEATPGSEVTAGEALVSSVDPALEARLRELQARVDELEASYAAEFVADRARAEIVRETLLAERAALARVRERVESPLVPPGGRARFRRRRRGAAGARGGRTGRRRPRGRRDPRRGAAPDRRRRTRARRTHRAPGAGGHRRGAERCPGGIRRRSAGGRPARSSRSPDARAGVRDRRRPGSAARAPAGLWRARLRPLRPRARAARRAGLAGAASPVPAALRCLAFPS